MDQKTTALPPYPDVDETEAARRAPARPGLPAFSEIFRDHAQFLWRALMNLGVPHHEAQDLCQEVMITVHRRLPDFQGSSLRAWMYGICVRVASDYRRRAHVRREIPHESVPDTGLAAAQADEVDRRRELRRAVAALDRLNEDKRAAFVLYEVEGLTLAEVAEALEVPLQTVYSRIKSARDTLRKDLGADESARGGVREAG